MMTEVVDPAATAAATASTGKHPKDDGTVTNPLPKEATSETDGSGERPVEPPVDNSSNSSSSNNNNKNPMAVPVVMPPTMTNATPTTSTTTTTTSTPTTKDVKSVQQMTNGGQQKGEEDERTNDTMKPAPPPPPLPHKPITKENQPTERTDPNHHRSERSTTTATLALTQTTRETTTSLDTQSQKGNAPANCDPETSSSNAAPASDATTVVAADAPTVVAVKQQFHSQSTAQPAPTTNPTSNAPTSHQQPPHTKPKATTTTATTTTTTTVQHRKATANATSKHNKSSSNNKSNHNKHKYARLFRDALTIEVPLTAPTVDLGILLPLARRHRIQALYRAFPACRRPKAGEQKETKNHVDTSCKGKMPTETNDPRDRDTDTPYLTAGQDPDPKLNNNRKNKNKSNKRSHVPQPQEFDNVLDYLEAKYVQGVMVDESDQEGGGGDDVDGDDVDDDDEMAGSVYSESSFINDTDLQRTIAEQVLAHATTTKLELQEDDNEFFVNVGNLEVEETEMNHPDYDPLQDTNARSTKTTASSKSTLTKKRKAKTEHGSAPTTGAEPKPTTKVKKEKLAAAKKKDSVAGAVKNTLDKTTSKSTAAQSSASSPIKKRKLKDEPDGIKKKKKLATAESPVKTTSLPPSSSPKRKKPKKMDAAEVQRNKKAETEQLAQNGGGDSEEDDDDNSANRSAGLTVDPNCSQEQLQQISQQRKAVMEEVYQQLVSMIQAAPPEVLPRKKTKERVSLTCPMDKKPGDSILFSNPHVPGQRLKVKIPKNTEPGGTFRVTVPVTDLNVKNAGTGGAPGDEETDYNKLGRVFHDAVDDYARAYDEWCDAEGVYRKAVGYTECAPHFEKRKKFDKLVKEFPKDLKTPVDLNYLKKVLRRARQNRSKRELTLARHASSQKNHVGSVASSYGAGAGGPCGIAASAGRKDTSMKTIPSMVTTNKLSSTTGKAMTTSSSFYTAIVPTLTKEFLSKNYNPSDFSFQ